MNRIMIHKLYITKEQILRHHQYSLTFKLCAVYLVTMLLKYKILEIIKKTNFWLTESGVLTNNKLIHAAWNQKKMNFAVRSQFKANLRDEFFCCSRIHNRWIKNLFFLFFKNSFTVADLAIGTSATAEHFMHFRLWI